MKNGALTEQVTFPNEKPSPKTGRYNKEFPQKSERAKTNGALTNHNFAAGPRTDRNVGLAQFLRDLDAIAKLGVHYGESVIISPLRQIVGLDFLSPFAGGKPKSSFEKQVKQADGLKTALHRNIDNFSLSGC